MTAISANWTTEVSQYCFLWSTTFASYIAARRGKLIGVELIQNMMPSFVKRIMKFISWMACACFYYIAIYYCCPNLPKLMSQTTPVLKWSMGVIYIIMLVGLAMLTLYSVYTAFYHLLVPEKKKDDSEKTAAEIAEEVE
jgi:TRAP-type C4-dicarboxylate transport system permease small subunit